MDGPMELGTLRPAAADSLESRLARFRKAWAAVTASNETVEVAEYLPAPGDPQRAACLVEMLKIDLESRFRIFGKGPRIDYYLELYPELGDARTLPASLIVQEYLARHQYGDKPDLNRYKNRFPEQFAEMQRLLDASQSMDATPSQSGATHPAQQTPNRGGGAPSSRTAPGVPPPPTSMRPSATAKVPSAPPSMAIDRAPAPKLKGSKKGTDIGGGYVLDDLLGRGAFGEVYRAFGPGGFPAAVKIIHRSLDHEDAQKELEVLEVLKNLSHPFLLQTLGYWSDEDQLIIVMELADASLHDRLKQCIKESKQGVPPEELLRFFRDAAEALDYLHEQGVMHRDIKPANILIKGRHAKVADFGLAKALPITQASIMVSNAGTPAYMAPEAWRGKISRKSDQYSLAATYVELRLNRRIFQSKDMFELMSDQLTKTPDLGGIPDAERAVLQRALDKDHHARFPTCSEFIDALNDAVRRGGPGLPAGSPHVPLASPTSAATPLNNQATRHAPAMTVPSVREVEVAVEPSAATDRISSDSLGHKVVGVRPADPAFLTMQLPDDLIATAAPIVPVQPRPEPVQVQPASSRRGRSGRQIAVQQDEGYLEEEVRGSRSFLTRFLVVSVLAVTGLLAYEAYAWSRLKAKVENLKDRHEYVQALDAISDSDPLLRRAFGNGLQTSVYTHWKGYLKDLRGTDPAAGAKLTGDLLIRSKRAPLLLPLVTEDYVGIIEEGVRSLVKAKDFQSAYELIRVKTEDPGTDEELRKKQDLLVPVVLAQWLDSRKEDPIGGFSILESKQGDLPEKERKALRQSLSESLNTAYLKFQPTRPQTSEQALSLARSAYGVVKDHERTLLVLALLDDKLDTFSQQKLLHSLSGEGFKDEYDQILWRAIRALGSMQASDSAKRKEGLKATADLLSHGNLEWRRTQLFDAAITMGEQDATLSDEVVVALGGIASQFSPESRNRLNNLREKLSRSDLRKITTGIRELKIGEVEKARPLWEELEQLSKGEANNKEIAHRVRLLQAELFSRVPTADKRFQVIGIFSDLLRDLPPTAADRPQVYEWLAELADNSSTEIALIPEEVLPANFADTYLQAREKLPADFNPALAYLLARKTIKSNSEEAAALLVRAWPDPKRIPELFQKEARKQFVTSTLIARARVAPVGFVPFSDASAAQGALDSLDRLEAQKIPTLKPAEAKALRILARWMLHPDQAQDLLREIESFLDQPESRQLGAREKLFLQLVRTQAAAVQGDGSRLAAALRASSFLALETDAAPGEFYDQVLQPALESQRKRATTGKSPALAALCALTGEWVVTNRDVAWSFGKEASAAQMTFRLYEEACRNDASNPDYLVRKTEACTLGLDTTVKLAQECIQRFPRHPGGYAMLGRLHLDRVGKSTREDERLSEARLAVDHLQKAIELLRTSGANLADDQLVQLYQFASSAQLWLGNLLYADSLSRKNNGEAQLFTEKDLTLFLLRAKETAQVATSRVDELREKKGPEYRILAARIAPHEPYMALGHACEDLAFYRGQTENFDIADKAFVVAAQLKPGFVGPLLARARCLLRAVGKKLDREKVLQDVLAQIEAGRNTTPGLENTQGFVFNPDEERVYLEVRSDYLSYRLGREKQTDQRQRLFTDALKAYDELIGFAAKDEYFNGYVQNYSSKKRGFLEGALASGNEAMSRTARLELSRLDDGLRAEYRQAFEKTGNPNYLLYLASTWNPKENATAVRNALESGLKASTVDVRHIRLARSLTDMMTFSKKKDRFKWEKDPTDEERLATCDRLLQTTRHALENSYGPGALIGSLTGRFEIAGLMSAISVRNNPGAFNDAADIYAMRGSLKIGEAGAAPQDSQKAIKLQAIGLLLESARLAPVIDSTEYGAGGRTLLIRALCEVARGDKALKDRFNADVIAIVQQAQGSKVQKTRDSFRDMLKQWEAVR